MIRPITMIAFVLACGSGLYLYQAKHRAQLLDRQIQQTVRETDALRDKIRMLRAEWTLLNDPERLRQLADQFLPLKTVAPGQFTSLAELGNRLPAVRPPEPPHAPEEETPEPDKPAASPLVSQAEPPPVMHAIEPAHAAPPPPPRPAAQQPQQQPVIAKASPLPERPPERKPVVTAQQQPAAPRPAAAEPHPVVSAALVQRTPVRALAPQPVAGGSLLGMAHGTAAGVTGAVPLPRPVPVSAPRFQDFPAGGG